MRHRGFFSIDGMAGLLVMVTLLIVIATVSGQRHRATTRLADTREATRLAEQALIDLQQNKPAPAGVTIADLPRTDGVTWVRVEATVNGRTASLFGRRP